MRMLHVKNLITGNLVLCMDKNTEIYFAGQRLL